MADTSGGCPTYLDRPIAEKRQSRGKLCRFGPALPALVFVGKYMGFGLPRWKTRSPRGCVQQCTQISPDSGDTDACCRKCGLVVAETRGERSRTVEREDWHMTHRTMTAVDSDEPRGPSIPVAKAVEVVEGEEE